MASMERVVSITSSLARRSRRVDRYSWGEEPVSALIPVKSGICSELSGGQRPPRSLAPGNGFPDRGRLFEWRGLMVFGFWQPENRTGCGPGRKDGGHQAGKTELIQSCWKVNAASDLLRNSAPSFLVEIFTVVRGDVAVKVQKTGTLPVWVCNSGGDTYSLKEQYPR